MRNYARTVGIAGIVLVGLTSAALAHAELKSATPAVGSTVSVAPAKIDLVFSESVNLVFTGATLVGPDKKTVPTGKASLADNGTTLEVPITGTLAAGQYTVTWHALSGDGHKTKGTYTFTLTP